MGSIFNLDRLCSFGEYIDYLCYVWIYSLYFIKWDGLRGGCCVFFVVVLIVEVFNWYSEVVIFNVYYILCCDY